MDGATQKNWYIRSETSRARSSYPIGRMASVAEIAETVAFLCSKSNTYIHGAVVPVTGGE